jgi:predicted ATP-grasp superfamily ATP-dependent carboligase
MSRESLRVLITDGNSRAALAATRSLGKRGYLVIAAAESRPSLAGASRYAAASPVYPDPVRHAGQFVNAIAAAVRNMSVDVLLPMTEITTLLLTRQRAILPPECTLPFSSIDAIDEASNKARVIELARELNIPTPATVAAESIEVARELVKALPFPVVIKPSRSRIMTRDGWISTRVEYARDANELNSRLSRLPPEIFPVLLQERISGAGIGIFLCYAHGRLVAAFAHRRLREKPSSGGVSVLCESLALPPEALEHSRRLLERLGWHGVAMVEFKQDDRDDSFRLMEINGRFWGSLQLAIDSGVDFPAILLDIARNSDVAPVDSYKVGVRSRWFLGDLDALLAALRKPGKRLDLPATHPSRLKHTWDFLHLFGRDTRYEVLNLKDPMPGLVELRRWLFRS